MDRGEPTAVHLRKAMATAAVGRRATRQDNGRERESLLGAVLNRKRGKAF